MPIPFLPLELVHEIVSQIKEEELTPAETCTKYGSAVSLVCKSWKPIGQDLRWKKLEVIAAQIPSLVEHLGRYPRFASLVHEFQLSSSKNLTADSDDQPSDALLGDLAALISSFSNLRVISIRGKLGRHLSSILKAASQLFRVKRCELMISNEVKWSEELSSSLEAGFRRTSLFLFTTRVLSVDDSPDRSIQF
jgi:hypothetical protein